MSKITIRLDENLKEQFKSYSEKRGSSMTEILKGQIESIVGCDDSNGRLPEEDVLAKGYSELWKIRTGKNRIPVDEAKTHLGDCLNLQSVAVRRQVLVPLSKRGYINVKAGMVSLNVDLDETLGESE